MPGRGAEPARDAHAERDGAPSVVEGGRRAVRRLHLLWRHAYDTNVTGLSGMVAFNLLLSIFPFALLVLFVVGKLAQSESVEASIVRELQRLFPHAAGGTLHRTLATLRGQFTQEAFDVGWADGRALTAEQAMAYALDDKDGKIIPMNASESIDQRIAELAD